MRVTVRLFARLRDITGATELTRDVPDRASVKSVWDQLIGEFPELGPYTKSISSAVNADYAPMETMLAEGDEVAFLPPVSGGVVMGCGLRVASDELTRKHQLETRNS